MSSLITYDHSQNQRQRLDEGRISLKEEILAFLKNEDAQVDLIKQSYSLLSKYPNLASLKSRIKYPEEISLNLETAVQDDKVIQDSDTKDCVNLSSSTAVFGLNIKDLTSLIHELENVSKTTHEIGTELLALANTAKDLFTKKTLKTNWGLEWSIQDLLFSTGLCTPYGGKYLPKDPKRLAFINEIEKKGKEQQKEYPIYRWGTKEEVDMLANIGIEMECIEEERIGALATTIDKKKASARFLQEAKSLAYQFLDE